MRELNADLGVMRDSTSNCSYIVSSWEEHFKRYDSLPDFYWDLELVHAITQSFFLGYMLSVIPVGIAADFYGPRFLLLLGFFISSVSTIVFPFLAKLGPFEGMTAMLCQGVGQGSLFAAIAVLIAHWAPVMERTRFVCMTESGKLLGVLIAGVFPVVFPQLVTYWELRFVLSGLLGLIMHVVCWLFLCDRPAICKHISKEEKDYVIQHCEGIVHKDDYMFPSVPWRAMVLSPPFLSMVLYSSCTDWFLAFNRAKMDNYLIDVLHFDRKLLDVVLYWGVVCSLVSTWLWGVASDLLIQHRYMSRTANRKLSGLIAMSVSVLMAYLTLLAGCDGVLVAVCQTAMSFSRGFVYSTVHAIPIDIGPRCAGVSMAVGSFGGYFAILLIRELYNRVIEESEGRLQWWTMFSIVAVVWAAGTLQFLVLGNADVQPWNYAKPRTSRDTVYLTSISSVTPRSSTENHHR